MQVKDVMTPKPEYFVPLRLVPQDTNATIELNRTDMVLGRHSEADIYLPRPDISRRHCRFTFRDGAWHVNDLNSLNGTFLNDVAVKEVLAYHGDTLRVGEVTFTIDLGGTYPPREDEMVLNSAVGFSLVVRAVDLGDGSGGAGQST